MLVTDIISKSRLKGKKELVAHITVSGLGGALFINGELINSIKTDTGLETFKSLLESFIVISKQAKNHEYYNHCYFHVPVAFKNVLSNGGVPSSIDKEGAAEILELLTELPCRYTVDSSRGLLGIQRSITHFDDFHEAAVDELQSSGLDTVDNIDDLLGGN